MSFQVQPYQYMRFDWSLLFLCYLYRLYSWRRRILFAQVIPSVSQAFKFALHVSEASCRGNIFRCFMDIVLAHAIYSCICYGLGFM